MRVADTRWQHCVTVLSGQPRRLISFDTRTVAMNSVRLMHSMKARRKHMPRRHLTPVCASHNLEQAKATHTPAAGNTGGLC